MNEAREKLELIRRKLQNDPVLFAWAMLGKKLTDYQARFVRDNSKRIIFVGGRKVGKTVAVAIKALWKAWCFDNQDILVVAPTFRQAGEMVYTQCCRMIESSPLLRMTCERMTITKTVFDNGSIIRCLPAGRKGDTIRGFTADMIIVDEGAYVPDEVYASILPSLFAKAGQVILVGTPAGCSGFFYEAWISKDWSKHHVPSTRSPFVDKEWIEKYRAMLDEVSFRREILAEFVDVDELWFNMQKVREQAVLKRRAHPEEGWVYYMGIDWARAYGGDENAIVVVGRNENSETDELFMHNYWVRDGRRDMSDVIGWAVKKIMQWRPRIVACDATSGWGTAVDRLRERLNTELMLNVQIVEIDFARRQVRENMYWTLRQLINEGKLWLLDDEKLKAQFLSYRVRYTSDGRERIAKEGKHDDVVDALAMACYVAEGCGTVRVSVADFLNIDELPPIIRRREDVL